MKNRMASGRKPAFGISTLVTLVLASGFAFPACAGRPLATEDAAVLDRGECEIESYAGRVNNGGGRGVSTRWAEFDCGIGRDTQLEVGLGAENADGEKTRPAALKGKTFLRKLTEEQTGFTLAYAWFGALEPGNHFRHDASELKAVVSVPRSGWLLHANLGLQYSQSHGNYSAIWGMAVERPGAFGPVDLMTEIVGDERSAPWLQIAARFAAIPERLYLDSSWGVQTDSARSKQMSVGLSIAF